MNAKLHDLNSNFIYKADKKRFLGKGLWYVMRRGADRKYRGDCEDYALTALFHLCGRSWFKFWFKLITFQADIPHCKSPRGGGHAILRYGHNRYIDNWYKKPHTKAELKSLGYTFGPFPWRGPYVVAYKLLISKIRG